MKITEDGEKIEAEVAIVEVDVKAQTAPEQEKKAAEEVILAGIDEEIAELIGKKFWKISVVDE